MGSGASPPPTAPRSSWRTWSNNNVPPKVEDHHTQVKEAVDEFLSRPAPTLGRDEFMSPSDVRKAILRLHWLNVAGENKSIFAVYRPPGTSNRLDKRELRCLLSPDTPTVVAGDTNCKHTLWNSNRICGRILYQDSLDHHYEVIGPDTWTHYEPNGNGDVIDIVVCKGLNTAPELSVMTDLPSDHRPSHSRAAKRENLLGLLPKRSPGQDQYQIRGDSSRNERGTKELTIAIQDSLAAATRTSAQANRLTPLPARIRDLIRKKREARKLWQETRCPRVKTEQNALIERVRVALDNHAAEGWEDHISSITDDIPSVHRLCRQLANTPKAAQTLIG
ncbi:putative endonuclease and reverse transcriptase-like protein, partial [Operophtera brumata]